MNPQREAPYRVLALEGGGMRGVYQAAYLMDAAARAQPESQRGVNIDVGGAFDLLVGTSTGGLIACALAAEVPLYKIKELYEKGGKDIFPFQTLRSMRGVGILFRLAGGCATKGEVHLREKLQIVFKKETLGELYERRGIALAIPSIDLGAYKAVVFKTRHLKRLDGRNDANSLVDVCLATSAAPILRTMARFEVDGATTSYLDGGLWANDPSLVALAEATEILEDTGQGSRPIHVFTLGSCSPTDGEVTSDGKLARGALGWRGGINILNVSMSAQSSAYSYLTGKLAEHRHDGSLVYRLPQEPISSELQRLASNMDDARKTTMDRLIHQARRDVDRAYQDRNTHQGLAAFFQVLADAKPITSKNVNEDE